MSLLTASAIRARVPLLSSTADFPDATLDELVTEFVELAAEYRGVSYLPVTGEVEQVGLDAERVIRLRWARVTAVASVSVQWLGSTVSVPLGVVQIQGPRDLDLGAAYTGQATITYSHGYTTPPTRLLRACREYVRASALRDRSNVGRDVITQAGEAGGTTRYSTPDWEKGRPTGFVLVDAELNSLPDYRTQGIG